VLRYFAMAWDQANPQQTLAARVLRQKLETRLTGWCQAYAGDGLAVFTAGAADVDINTLDRNSGVVIGTLFKRDSDFDSTPAAIPQLDTGESSRIVASGGRQLVSSFWGSYVAFLSDALVQKKWVIAAPMGSLPCFTARFADINLFFSRMEDCVQLRHFRFSVNWDCLAAHVALNSVRCSETALNEVSEVKPGECVELAAAKSSRSFYWHPCSFAELGHDEDIGRTASAVRIVGKGVIHAWASRHGRIVQQLSGGLDSSTVLGSLRDAPTRPEIVCINDYSAGSNGDERCFARLAAGQANCELVEHRREPDLNLERMLEAVRTAKPFHHFMQLVNALPTVELARSRKATAVFTGTLGDALFYHNNALPAAADYVWNHGLHPGLCKVSFDVALRDRVSVWRALRYALSHGLFKRRTSYWSLRADLRKQGEAQSGLINPAIMQAVAGNDRFVHPWLRTISDVPPGKLWHMVAIGVDPVDDPFAQPEDPLMVHPLMSQPLTELCLRIPTYMHLRDGWERAILRRAFSADLPEEIRTRTSKGGLEEYAKDIVTKNMGFVRQLLLDGILVRERILNRRRLEDALSGEPRKISLFVATLLAYLSKEIWLESWTAADLSPTG
jgi:asparagine synthase (glutamine-hydrolysing)